MSALRFWGELGQSYRIQPCTNLPSGNSPEAWLTVTNLVGGGTFLQVTDAQGASFLQRAYRLASP